MEPAHRVQIYDEIVKCHGHAMPECIQDITVQEYHCGRLQGRTKKQARAIAESEGIDYETFRFQGEAEVCSIYGVLL